MHCRSSILAEREHLSSYLNEIHKFPLLKEGEEFQLARDWAKTKDKKAIEKLIKGHLRLIVKIASGYSGYGLQMKDLISEGHVGIMQAAKHFNPDLGYKFSTYSTWWIKARIQEYIFNSWSLVKLSSSKAHKKLFFGLRKLKSLLGIDSVSNDNVNLLAEKLNIDSKTIMETDNRLSNKDFSVNAQIGDSDSKETWQDFIVDDKASAEEKAIESQELDYRRKLFNQALQTIPEREKNIIVWYRLTEPPLSLAKIGEKLKISRERVRQLEERAFFRLQEYIKEHDK